MEWRRMEAIAKSLTPEGDRLNGVVQWHYNITVLAKSFGGYRPEIMSAFLNERSVPHYCIGKNKMFFLPEVLEAIEGTRWAEKDGRRNNGKRV